MQLTGFVLAHNPLDLSVGKASVCQQNFYDVDGADKGKANDTQILT